MDQNTYRHQTAFSISLAALGIVYGDIGTSPLYAVRESLSGLPINNMNILGILSLIFWSLVIVISVKYLIIIFRADNDGEGGILALLALLKSSEKKPYKWLLLIGIFGGGLMLGDGMLTPAISVVSAIEGLYVISPAFSHWVIPLACVILIALFSFQSLGTAKIGFSFGPIIFIWFAVLAALGLNQIFHNPIVLKAINPFYAFNFFINNGWKGYVLLGGVFLVVTGGEALFADIGHFGKNPIRLAWFSIALPGLLINYFGQGAYLLTNPSGIINPFYVISPSWFSIPLLVLATMATIIASQAVISATFSLTKQAVLLGLYPHLPIIQTSATEKGQIFVPQMNIVLAIGTFLIIITFKSSSAIAHAYGIAVNLVMVLTTLMTIYIARYKWQWNIPKIVVILSLFLIIDLIFLGSNIQKIKTGGWVPLFFAAFCAFIMITWNKGMDYLRSKYYKKKEELSDTLNQLHSESITLLKETTMIFITDIYDKSGGALLHFLKLNRAIPENILILSYIVENIPYVPIDKRFEANCLDKNVCQLILHYGFMDFVNVPKELSLANKKKIMEFYIDLETAVYLVEIPNVIASKQVRSLLLYWQEKLFAFFTRNYSSNLNIDFYQLPYNRTMAIGTYYVI